MRNISESFGSQMGKGLLVIFCLSIIFLGSACEPSTNVKGIVKDKSGAALKGVTVTMFSVAEIGGDKKKESEQKTDELGKFNFVTITPGAKSVTLVFSKQGFRPFEKEMPANTASEFDVILEPAAE